MLVYQRVYNVTKLVQYHDWWPNTCSTEAKDHLLAVRQLRSHLELRR
jgi:hypothetical protein